MEFKGITLVTGAAGFMGSHLVEFLAGKGVRVRASARPRKDTSFFDRLGVEYVPADLTKPETLPGLFEGDVDRIFHLGAICNFSTPYESLAPTNVEGVKRITQLAMKKGIKRYVHVGSTSVYGYYQGTPFREDSPRNPQDSYGRSKRDGEDVVWGRIKEGFPAIITRPCTVYGPRCNDGAGKAFSRPSSITAIPGSGRQLLSNVRAEDVAAAVYHLSLTDDAVGQAFNLAEDTHPTLEEALTLAAQAFGAKPPTTHLPLWLVKIVAKIDGAISARKGRIPDLELDAVKYLYADYVVDNSKLKGTGYRMIYPDFRQSMKQIGEWYRANCGAR
ncbi:MAG TPA: NAD-dependent epimerase/dehydratase family protein [Smithellaceae bacterium]|nr:NAD-dependent epimerase/dehydratase family protein [Smithellaceae bacterium]HRS84024.1 NAD-dependent epimerase/dehydratase family protein [Smithellaceae bacterium]HRV45716.1 NAD-dependent epimerase/dehydratase family protein [Smithellaceae bacterium]